jgi:hypothetical protein
MTSLVLLTEHHAMRGYWVSGDMARRILELVVNFTPRPLYPHRKSPWYPLDRMPGGIQSRSGRGGEEKNSQTLAGLEPNQTFTITK